MMRDVPMQHVMGWWHNQAAPRVTSKSKGLQMCIIEKLGTKHWKQLLCTLQNRTERFGGLSCIPNETIAEDTPKFVFLRDPLEQFLSGMSKRKHSSFTLCGCVLIVSFLLVIQALSINA